MLNDPTLHPSHRRSLCWRDVWAACERSKAVGMYESSGNTIWWVGEEEPEVFHDPQAALNAIREMEAH